MQPECQLVSVEELASMVKPGAMLAIPKDESGAAISATRALIRRGIRDLHLLCAPVCGMQARSLDSAPVVSQSSSAEAS